MTETAAPPPAATPTRNPPQGGVVFWFGVLGGIGAWLAHLIFLASFVRFTCTHHGATWVQHLVTVVTGVATVVALLICLRLLRAVPAGDGEAAGTPWGRTRFLALFGLLSNSISLALILAEGSYVLLIRMPCG